MNGVSNITEKILGEARALADETVTQAREKAEEIRQQYAAQAAAQSQETLAQAKARAEAIAERAASQCEMDRKKMMLTTRQESIGKAFDAALAKMAGMDSEQRVLMMIRMAVRYQTADAEFIFNKADQKEVGPLVVATVNEIYKKEQIKNTFSGTILEQIKKLVLDQPARHTATLSKQIGEFAGGFILKQGNIEHNCTFEVLVSAVRDDLEGEVSSILYA